jgi:hypothetical protein
MVHNHQFRKQQLIHIEMYLFIFIRGKIGQRMYGRILQ